MAYIVRMPKLGVEMERGEVLAWYVEAGDAVEEGDVLAEIESEKSVAEVAAREDGVLRRRLLAEGESTEPGGPMAIVAAEDADIGNLEAELVQEEPPPASTGGDGAESGTGSTDAGVSATSRDRSRDESVAGADDDGPTRSEGTPAAKGADGAEPTVKVTPRAKKRARDLGVDPTGVEGTGPQGAVTESDVEAAAPGDSGDGAGPDTDGSTGAAERTVRRATELGPTRQTIADRLGRSSREAVHVTVHREITAAELFEAVDRADEQLQPDVGVMDVLLVAVAATLAAHPAFNATFEDGEHRTYEEQNVGVAVDAESGLVTPVVRDVGSRSLADVASERRRLTDRALAGDHEPADLAGGTFTVSNLGALGVDAFTPIIDPPQVAILGVNRPGERATRTERGVAVEPVLPLDLTFDHRVVDGADAARFLETLAGHLRSPGDLLDPSAE
jgi:pyruvate dehydrogenase E2 component (dihydrolipoamide acetyltransferase)